MAGGIAEPGHNEAVLTSGERKLGRIAISIGIVEISTADFNPVRTFQGPMKVASIAQTVEEQPHIRRQFKDVSDDVHRPFDPAADTSPNLEFVLAAGDDRQGEPMVYGRDVL